MNEFCYHMVYKPMYGLEQGEILLMNYSMSSSVIMLLFCEPDNRYISSLKTYPSHHKCGVHWEDGFLKGHFNTLI